jgi:hypothetical protein
VGDFDILKEILFPITLSHRMFRLDEKLMLYQLRN